MKINMAKLSKYVENGDILEFKSDQECLEYFNTYDFQDFKTVDEMKVYQGKYGFNIGNRRYHINVESALDVYVSKEMYFTEEELTILSNGILALINNAGTAKTLVTDSNTHSAIDAEIEKLVALNAKICRRMEK